MRILQIAPPWESVPPAAYGGTEAVVYLLCEELVRLGHEVTLWASGDSATSARLRSCVPASLRTSGVVDPLPYAWQHAVSAIADAPGFDIVHNHAGEELMALAALTSDTPMLTTTHCNTTDDRRFIWDRYDGYYNTISWAQIRSLNAGDRARFAGVAYNGINVRSFPFADQKDSHLLFLSRIAPEKGAHIAIEIARRAGKRLLMAGKISDVDREYYVKEVEPLVDNDTVIFLGEADAAMKRLLYKNAYCLLMPIVWDEPFGLVMAEAQACGTPVVIFDRGAAHEIVSDGETGFVVQDEDEAVQAIARVRGIRPDDCRRWVASRFDSSQMAQRYLEIYGDILAGTTRRANVSSDAPASVNGGRRLDPAGGRVA